MTVKQLAEKLSIPLEDGRRLERLFEYEGYTGVRLSAQGPSWEVKVTSEILDWEGVNTLDDYLKRREAENSKTPDQIAAVYGTSQ
jgi:hypothetical protein